MKVLAFCLLCLISCLLCPAQDTLKTEGVFVAARKQNPKLLLRFYPTTFIVKKDSLWYDDKGRAIPYKLLYRRENNNLVAVH